jgi:hypothetical protein
VIGTDSAISEFQGEIATLSRYGGITRNDKAGTLRTLVLKTFFKGV